MAWPLNQCCFQICKYGSATAVCKKSIFRVITIIIAVLNNNRIPFTNPGSLVILLTAMYLVSALNKL